MNSAEAQTSPGMGVTLERVTSPRLREARFEDHQQIAALKFRNGMTATDYDEWTHRWVQNPVYQERRNWPIGWVLEGASHKIVAHIANVPLSYQFKDQRIMGATSGDLVADTRYRLYAFRLLRQYLGQENVHLLVDTTANATAAKAHQVFHSSRVPAGTWDRAAFWITNCRGFLKSVLTRKRVPYAMLLSFPLSLGLCLKEKAAKIPLRGAPKGFDINTKTRFDQSFDKFWAALTKSYPNRLLGTRSQHTLCWHFKRALTQRKIWISTVVKASSMEAYSVFMRSDIPKFGLKRMKLIDFQALDGRLDLLLPMLEWALERCRMEGVDILEAVGFSADKQAVIDSLSPYSRKLSSWLYFYKVHDNQLAEDLKHPDVWDPSCFDGDASL